MRNTSRARHADPRVAVPRMSDRRRRGSHQARPAFRRNDCERDPVAVKPEFAVRLPLPLGYSLGFGGL
jgi:hypothetical protein